MNGPITARQNKKFDMELQHSNKGLSVKQHRFCLEYLSRPGMNATEAAIRAGYSEKSAKVTASRLLTNANVQNKIAEIQKQWTKETGITAARIIEELKKLAFSNITDMYESWTQLKPLDSVSDELTACIGEIATKVVKKNQGTSEDPEIVDVEYIRVRMHDKLKAIWLLCRMLGFDKPTVVELTRQDGGDLFTLPRFILGRMSNQDLKTLSEILERAWGNFEQIQIDSINRVNTQYDKNEVLKNSKII